MIFSLSYACRKTQAGHGPSIDGHLWLSCGLSGDLSATSLTSCPCYEYNFKVFSLGLLAAIPKTCIKCKVQHPACNCNLFKETKFQPGNRNMTLTTNPINANKSLATGYSAPQVNACQSFQFAATVSSPVQSPFQQNQRQPYSFQARLQQDRHFQPAKFRSHSRYMGPRANSN